MRDDLFKLFQNLLDKYNSKLELLEAINSNETQLKYYLKSDKISTINDLIQADNDLFIKLDTIEFEIQSLIDKICQISGINKSQFTACFLNKPDNPLPDLNNLIKKINKIISELSRERDKLIRSMEKKYDEMQKEISSLNITRRLK